VLTGDIIHHPIQLAFPKMPTQYCEDPALASRVRVDMCERYAGSGSRLLTAHFPAPSSGRIVRDGTRFAFRFDAD
jgi:hypothetical protein